MIEETTPKKKIPLPNIDNLLSEDVEVLRQALRHIDKLFLEMEWRSDNKEENMRTFLYQTKSELEKLLEWKEKRLSAEIKKARVLALAGL